MASDFSVLWKFLSKRTTVFLLLINLHAQFWAIFSPTHLVTLMRRNNSAPPNVHACNPTKKTTTFGGKTKKTG
jgi:hypothetical protein